jgi:putative transposase
VPALAESKSVRAHVHILMGNHVHLPMAPANDRGPARPTKGLDQRDVQRINRIYCKTGTLLKGRLRLADIEPDGDRLAVRGHSNMKSVRARLIPTAEDDPWSNYRCNAWEAADPMIAPRPLYSDLADGDEARPSGYRGRFADALPQDMLKSLRNTTNGGFVRCTRRMQQQIATMVCRRTWTGAFDRPRDASADTDQLDLPI